MRCCPAPRALASRAEVGAHLHTKPWTASFTCSPNVRQLCWVAASRLRWRGARATRNRSSGPRACTPQRASDWTSGQPSVPRSTAQIAHAVWVCLSQHCTDRTRGLGLTVAALHRSHTRFGFAS
eukprot:5513530-Prymnesium_polylepis.1